MIGVVASSHAPAAAWVPTDLSTLVGWWDATSSGSFTYSNGDDPGDPGNKYVSKWDDLSGAGNHATGNANRGYHPKRSATINSLPAIDFSPGYIAAGKSLGVAGLLGTELKPMTGLCVVRMPGTLADKIIFGSSGATVTIRVLSSGGLDLLVPTVGTIGSTSSGVVTGGGEYLIDWSYGSSGEYTIYVDGSPAASGTNNRTPSSGASAALGAGNNTSYGGFAGVIGEMIVCDQVLSSGDRSDARSYLTSKWGL